MEEGDNQTPSLFPAFNGRKLPQGNPIDAASASPIWLKNRSFTTDIFLINEAVAKYKVAYEDEDDEEEKVEELHESKQPMQYEMMPSSPSHSSTSSAGDDTKKRKKHKKRRKVESLGPRPSYNYAETITASYRKSRVQKWASSSTTDDKEFYFDSRGDRDNLAFGCIYRMDVARYKLYNCNKGYENNYFKRGISSVSIERDMDADALDMKLRSGGRYWSSKYAVIERDKNMKHMRILLPRKSGTNLAAEYISLSDECSNNGQVSSVSLTEESWEDELLRKTKEFNRTIREHPQDGMGWLAFAEFQDKVASMQSHKGARLQTLDKKISILENATKHIPESEDLLLSLMNAYQRRESTDVLIKRWEKVLKSNPGSYKLWREFLRVARGEFSRFKVSDMRKMHANAIQAVAGACVKQHRQAHQSGHITPNPAFIQLELGLVDLFIGLCRLEWQAGYQEVATALFQAELEYNLFCPLGLSEQSKRRLFEHFWSSHGARIGEDGALGWSTWLEKEEEQRQKLMNDKASNIEDEGGWTGWFEPPSNIKDIEDPETATNVDMVVEEIDEGSETIDAEQKDDIESLLKAIGIDAAAEADIKVTDIKMWSKWSKEEMTRDTDHWMPLHANSGPRQDAKGDLEDDEQLLSTILYEDVSDYLFSLNSEEARLSLICQFIDFYEGRITQWTCTNNSSWVEKILGLDDLPHSLLEDVRKVQDVLIRKLANPSNPNLELLLNSSDDLNARSEIMKFLRNVVLLCLNVFPENYILEEAVLVAEELSNTRMNSTSCSVTPCRTLAKTMLKSNRQDLFLCGIYAQREANSGNIDHSRKVFDMALLSIEGLPVNTRPNATLLYFWYAQVEHTNAHSASSENVLRAIHILSCLGSGEKYSPFKGSVPSLQQLRARQGFKDRIKILSLIWARGVIDDNSAALICSAALFEELTSGWASALEILESSFTMVLPERRRQSRQLEFLFHYYVKVLYKNHRELKLSKVLGAIEKGLQIYPFSPRLYGVLVEISYLRTSANKLRWMLDDYCQKNPSVIVYLYALSFEISIGGSEGRTRAIFERALEDVKLHHSVILWRCYIGYETDIAYNYPAAKRVFFRAIHACPWSKKLWLDGFMKLESVLTVKEVSDLQEVMRDKELNLRTDIYEILLQEDEMDAQPVNSSYPL